MLWLTLSMLLAPSAQAQEWECSGPLTHQEWAEVMDQVDAAFRTFDIAGAKEHATGIHDRIRCLDEVVLPSYLGRYARQRSLIAFFQQDEAGAVRWGMVQRFAAEELPWPPDIDLDHPARNAVAFASEPPLSGPENKGLAFPKKGAVFMNGELLVRPLARAEVPNLLQVTDKKGAIVLQYWQDGGAFRDEVLTDDYTSVPTPPKWFEPEDRSLWAPGPPLFEATEEEPPAPAPAPVTPPADPPPVEEAPAEAIPVAEAPPEEAPVEEPTAEEPSSEEPPVEAPEALAAAPEPDPEPAADAQPDPGPAEPEGADEAPPTADGVAEAQPDAAPAKEPAPQPAPAPEPAPAAAPQPAPQPEPEPVDIPPPPKEGTSGPKVGMLIAAGGLGVASGALYTTGYLSRGGLSDATDTGELAAARTRVNVLAASAGVMGLGAVGVGVTAFVDGRTAGFSLRF